MSSFCSSNFHFDFSLVCYSNICYRLSETNAPEHRVQTSLKRCGLNFLQERICLQNSLGGGGGAGPFFSSKSINCKFRNFREGFYFRETLRMQSSAKIKPSQNVLNALSFTDVGKSCQSRTFKHYSR